MKRNLKIIICLVAAAAAAAGAVFAGLKIIRHEQEQARRIQALESGIRQLTEKSAEAGEPGGGADPESLRLLAGYEARITRLETQAEYAEADCIYFAVGNSITRHPVNEVWWNDIGMSASSAEKDFVHLTAAYLAGTRGKTAANAVYLYDWEVAEARREKLKLLDPYLDPRIDLVTVQLGENAEDLSSFETDLEELIRYIQEKAPDARILVIDDFWNSGEIVQMKKAAAEHTGSEFVSLAEIKGDPEYQAGIGTAVYDAEGKEHRIEHPAVASHPGDKGMRYIADRIIDALRQKPEE